MQIKVITKRPGKPARRVNISNTLESLQKYVGGYIETMTLGEYCTIICDEEGRLKGKPYNCTICGVDFVGDIIIAGFREGYFTDLSISFEQDKRLFNW